MGLESKPSNHPERGKFTDFLFILSQAPWTQNVLCEPARRKKSGFTVRVIWKARKETFKLLFKQVSFQLLLSSMSKSIILTFDTASACQGDWGICLHIFFLFFFFLKGGLLLVVACSIMLLLIFPTAVSTTELLLHGHKIK